MGRVDPAGVRRPGIRSFDLPLQIPSSRPGRRRSPHQGDFPDARPLRVPARPCPPASRRLGDQPEENSSDLQRVGPSTAQQDAEAKRQGETARRLSRSFHFERYLGHGLRPWPIGDRQKIRVLTVVDTFSRFSPALDPRFSYRAEDVVATLERACATMGYGGRPLGGADRCDDVGCATISGIGSRIFCRAAGGTAADNRLFGEAVLFRFRAGVPWRDLPERFGD